MKKLILACFIMLFSGGVLFAQQTQSARPLPAKTKTVKKDVAHTQVNAAKPANQQHQTPVVAAKKSTTPATAVGAAPLKKDGTPDKRYKKHSQHMKKDGKADKRFKENKQQ